MSTPTKKQQVIFEYVKEYISQHKFSPTFEEIRKKFKLKALSGVHQHIQALVEKGLVKMQNFSQSKNKLRYAYLLTPAGVAEKSKLTTEFLKRKVAEYETLQAEIEALRAEL